MSGPVGPAGTGGVLPCGSTEVSCWQHARADQRADGHRVRPRHERPRDRSAVPAAAAACAQNKTPAGASGGGAAAAAPALAKSEPEAQGRRRLRHRRPRRRLVQRRRRGGPGEGPERPRPVKTNTKELAAAANESEDAAATRLTQLVTDGYNPIIAVGFNYASAVRPPPRRTRTSSSRSSTTTRRALPNVTPLVFAEEQASFLVGAAAALKTTTCKVGFVGGVETPLIQKFEAGYVAGREGGRAEHPGRRQVHLPAGDFSGFDDPAKATEIARGACTTAAPTSSTPRRARPASGVFQARRRPASWPSASTPTSTTRRLPALQEVIMTSMVKRVDTAVYDYINAAAGPSHAAQARSTSRSTASATPPPAAVDDIKAQLEAYKAAIVERQHQGPHRRRPRRRGTSGGSARHDGGRALGRTSTTGATGGYRPMTVDGDRRGSSSS